MYKIVRSELLKWFSGKMIYLSILATFFITAAEHVVTGILVRTSPESVPGLAETIGKITAQDYILNSIVNLISGGTLFIIITIITATVITDDYGKGTLKYFLLATTRTRLIIGKIITAGIINLVLVAAAFTASAVIGITAYPWLPDGFAVYELIAVYLLGWLTTWGYSSLLMFAIHRFSRISGSIGLGIALFMSLGMLGVILPERFSQYVITAGFYSVAGMTPGSWSQSFLISSAYIAFFSALNVMVFRKKEMLR